MAERLRRRVAALDWSFEGKPIPLTLSAGAASDYTTVAASALSSTRKATV